MRYPKYIKNNLGSRYGKVIDSSFSLDDWIWVKYHDGAVAFVPWPQANFEEISKEEYLASIVLES